MADLWTSIGDLLGLNKGKGTINAANANSGVLDSLNTQMGGIIDQGDKRATGYLEEILGLSGYEMGADPREAFTASPGSQFQVDQGLQALDRRSAAAGRFSSGNADLDTMTYASGLADQEWDDWLGNITRGLGDMTTLSRDVTGQKLGLAGDIGSGKLNVNNQVAAGQEAGQGAIWDLFGNIAGTAGAAFGLGKPPGAPAAPAVPPPPSFGGYGRGW
jgi:hypothetical protein